MSEKKSDDEFFPGFIEDDTPPRKPVPPPVEEDDASGFNPFADESAVESVSPDPAAPVPHKDGPPSGAAVAPGTPAAPPVAGGFDAFSGAGQQPDEEPEEDVAPGARKDLWVCPHCGAKNRPDRDTCRSCGKSPDEPVVAPWHRQPKVIIAIAGAALVVVLLLIFTGGERVDMRAASLAGIDNDLRRQSGVQVELPLGDGVFVSEGRFAAVGRVAQVRRRDEHLMLTLGFADRSRDGESQIHDEGADDVGVRNALGGISRVPYARLVVLDPDNRIASDISTQDVVSVYGHYGSSEEHGTSNPGGRRFVLLIEGFDHLSLR
ncbi:MAG: hypothetical protein EA401_06295 [Planctomycetota bacterium]|nr:MAG: hypothetical protein EA401_06295 [Planctomycetota bacterium]